MNWSNSKNRKIEVVESISLLSARIIPILVYYLFLTPVGFLIKIFKKDLLNRNVDRKTETYWVKRVRVKAAKKELEKVFYS